MSNTAHLAPHSWREMILEIEVSKVLVVAIRFSEEIPNEENEINNDNLSKSSAEAKPEGSPLLLHKKVVPNSTIPSPGDTPIAVRNITPTPTYIHILLHVESSATMRHFLDTTKHNWRCRFVSLQFDLPAEDFVDFLPDGELLTVPLLVEEKTNDTSGPGGPVPSPSLDFNDNEDIPTELSDSSETHDEGT